MDLVNRLKYFLEKHNIAISQFADTCGIPRPTLSQILNGRNKKISDELISKIHSAYPQLSVLWLMFGEGNMEVDANIGFSEAQNQDISHDTPSQYPDLTSIEPSESDFISHRFSAPENHQISGNDLFSNPNTSVDSYDGQFFTESTSETEPKEVFDNSNTSTFTQTGTTAQTTAQVNSEISFYPRQANRPAQQIAASQHPNVNDSNDTSEDKHTGHDSKISAACSSTLPGATTPLTASPTESTTNRNHPAPDSPLEKAEPISLQPEPGKKITNIVVFYSDNSFQSFSPS